MDKAFKSILDFFTEDNRYPGNGEMSDQISHSRSRNNNDGGKLPKRAATTSGYILSPNSSHLQSDTVVYTVVPPYATDIIHEEVRTVESNQPPPSKEYNNQAFEPHEQKRETKDEDNFGEGSSSWHPPKVLSRDNNVDIDGKVGRDVSVEKVNLSKYTNLIVNGQNNQYSTFSPSACTLIAVEACLKFLKSAPADISKPSFIDSIISVGSKYQSEQHLDANTVLTSFHRYISSLEQPSGPIQHPLMDIELLVSQILSEWAGKHKFRPIGAVLIRPPETIVLFITTKPSEQFYSEQSPQPDIYLFDSHPRPLHDLDNAHVLKFHSELAIVDYLKLLFPVDDGVGDGEFGEGGDDMAFRLQLQMLRTIEANIIVSKEGLSNGNEGKRNSLVEVESKSPDETIFEQDLKILALTEELKTTKNKLANAQQKFAKARSDLMDARAELTRLRERPMNNWLSGRRNNINTAEFGPALSDAQISMMFPNENQNQNHRPSH